MRASMKRFIWFFGTMTFYSISSWIRIATHQPLIEWTDTETLLKTAIVFIPILFFDDDEEETA